MPKTVAQEDQPRFVALVLEEFKTLHAGNAIRFGLRPLEFSAWQEKNAEHGCEWITTELWCLMMGRVGSTSDK